MTTQSTNAPGTRHGSLLGPDRNNARLRRRRWAVIRLRAYGITAISLAILALLALLGSVVYQTAGAVSESYIVLPVELQADEIDPDGTANRQVIRKADYNGLTKDALKAAFPTVTDRKAKKQLYNLVSSGAAFELGDRVSADPALIGQTVQNRFLASDVTDLYLKGSFGRLETVKVTGSLTGTSNGKTVKLTSSTDDFAAALQTARQALLKDAKRLRSKAMRQNNGVAVFQRQADEATDETARAEALQQVAERTLLRDELLAEATELEARAASTHGEEKLTRNMPSLLLKVGSGWVKLTRISANSAQGRVLTPVPEVLDNTGDWTLMITDLPEAARKIPDLSIALIEDLKDRGAIEQVFNWRFFTASDSREPELAGIRGAIVGSALTMLVTFLLAFPTGVMAAIYLEEFAPKNRITGFVEVNINNLAAVPSIVFGLLGLAVFLGTFGVPRSSPLAGGIVLALMTLPTIIIAARAAIRAVPPSIRDAALGVGASKLQATFHHVLPLAMPGILTGTIIGMAQALGETAPLIMIGMVAFIVDIPATITDSASVLPVQVFRWSDFPERAFQARTGAAISVLLVFLVVMNAIAILLRRRFERRW